MGVLLFTGNHHGAQVIGVPDRAQCIEQKRGQRRLRAQEIARTALFQVPYDEAAPRVRQEGVGVAWARRTPLLA